MQVEGAEEGGERQGLALVGVTHAHTHTHTQPPNNRFKKPARAHNGKKWLVTQGVFVCVGMDVCAYGGGGCVCVWV